MYPRRVVIALGAAIAVAGCLKIGYNDDDDSNDTLDPAKMETYMDRNYVKIPILIEALSRIVAAANGQSAAGVTFSNITGGVQGTVGLDLDQNGAMESSINAKLIYVNPAQGINGGATFTVTNITTPYVSGSSTSTVTVVGNGSQVNFTSGTADFTPNYGPHVTIPSASLTVTPSLTNPKILGYTDFEADNKTGTIFFENNPAGGFKMRVASPDFAGFTVP